MSDMETEPPDSALRPFKSYFPEINDESMAEYERLKSIEHSNMTSDESLRYTKLGMSIKMQKIQQEATSSNARHNRQAAQSNDKRRKQKEPKKKATDPPPKETDNDRCHLTYDATLVGYQKDYDDLASLKEHKLGELALILPCPVLDCPENKTNSSSLNDPPENNAKKHSRQASHDSKKAVNSNTNGGFTSPKKVAKKLKLSDPIAGTSQPISVKNKFSSLAGKEAKVIPPISNQATAPVAAPPLKSPQLCSNIKKENYKIIIKDLNKDFPNCDVKLAGKYLKIFTTTSDEHRALTDYLDEKREEFYVINPLNSRPQKVVIKGLPVSTEIGEIQADLTSQGFCVEKVAQLTRSKTKSPLPIFMVELKRSPDSPQISLK
ncbi:nucleic-acid-binding protein from transposon X-element [Trichonephila clavipes]|nr:nucleic-acid-binding protein from transposon X-element [Trichonephila clavipes]